MKRSNHLVTALSACAIALLVASFVLPPTGVIDNSVIAGVGEIFAFASLAAFTHERHVTKTFSRGSTTITFTEDDKKDNLHYSPGSSDSVSTDADDHSTRDEIPGSSGV